MHCKSSSNNISCRFLALQSFIGERNKPPLGSWTGKFVLLCMPVANVCYVCVCTIRSVLNMNGTSYRCLNFTRTPTNKIKGTNNSSSSCLSKNKTKNDFSIAIIYSRDLQYTMYDLCEKNLANPEACRACHWSDTWASKPSQKGKTHVFVCATWHMTGNLDNILITQYILVFNYDVINYVECLMINKEWHLLWHMCGL